MDKADVIHDTWGKYPELKSMLKPCPFCGDGRAYTLFRTCFLPPGYVAVCMNCGAQTKSYSKRVQAENAWNARVREG